MKAHYDVLFQAFMFINLSNIQCDVWGPTFHPQIGAKMHKINTCSFSQFILNWLLHLGKQGNVEIIFILVIIALEFDKFCI